MAIIVQAHESGNNPLDTVIIQVPPLQKLM
jgi:hypothetical protein